MQEYHTAARAVHIDNCHIRRDELKARVQRLRLALLVTEAALAAMSGCPAINTAAERLPSDVYLPTCWV